MQETNAILKPNNAQGRSDSKLAILQTRLPLKQESLLMQGQFRPRNEIVSDGIHVRFERAKCQHKCCMEISLVGSRISIIVDLLQKALRLLK